MIVRIAFHRANPRSGMINVKREAGQDSVKAMGIAEEKFELLPGCLTSLLKEKILPLARRDNAAEFKTTTLVLGEVQAAIDENRQRLLDLWEMVSGGKDTIELDMWLAELEKGLLFNDLNVSDAQGNQHRCRFSIPQAKAAFVASTSLPAKGMVPEEIFEICARCGIDKYKQCAPLGPGGSVAGFIKNLLGDADEEQVIHEATGGPPIVPKAAPSPPKPKPKSKAPEPPPPPPPGRRSPSCRRRR